MAEKIAASQNSKLENLNELRKREINTDVEIICKNGTVIAHRIVLMSSCLYFDCMFSTEMIEKHSGRVKLTKCTKETIETVVEFLYTDRLPLLTERDIRSLINLVQTCHMMQIEVLLDHCWDSLVAKGLSVNFFQLWKFAIKYDLKNNRRITGFVLDHFWEIAEHKNMIDFTENEVIKLMECLGS
uniref:BTB domain-containing protein n=1 Tax=Strigamia maritima TaxID=126957 RepID=T1IJE2_STRMM